MKNQFVYRSMFALTCALSLLSFSVQAHEAIQPICEPDLESEAVAPAVELHLKLGNAKVVAKTEKQVLTLSFQFPGSHRRPDWSLAAIVLLAVDARENAVYHAGLIRGSTPDPDGQRLQTALDVVNQLEGVISREDPPGSLDEIGSFDNPSRLEKFQSELGLNDRTPIRFRSNYAAVFSLFAKKLPAALVPVLRTEYFLDDKDLDDDSLPARIIQAAYGVDAVKAVAALEKLQEKFVRAIVNEDSRLEVSPAHFGLVPHEFNTPPQTRSAYRPRITTFIAASGDVASVPGADTVNGNPLRHSRSSYDFPGYTERHTAMVDDLPHELIGMDIIVKLNGMGIQTIEEMSKMISGQQLMYEFGLSRNEIRDLYYYVREYYGLKLALGEEFGITLNIFRPEFRRKHPRPAARQ